MRARERAATKNEHEELEMKTNMGSIDRTARLLIAAGLGAVVASGAVTGVGAVVAVGVAVVMTATSAAGVCPLYLPFGWSTKRKAVRSESA